MDIKTMERDFQMKSESLRMGEVGNAFGQGGVRYRYNNEYIPSLWGMAHYAAESPNNVAGCGAYVLQFGYAEGNHLNLPVPNNNYYYASGDSDYESCW